MCCSELIISIALKSRKWNSWGSGVRDLFPRVANFDKNVTSKNTRGVTNRKEAWMKIASIYFTANIHHTIFSKIIHSRGKKIECRGRSLMGSVFIVLHFVIYEHLFAEMLLKPQQSGTLLCAKVGANRHAAASWPGVCQAQKAHPTVPSIAINKTLRNSDAQSAERKEKKKQNLCIKHLFQVLASPEQSMEAS